MFNTYVEVLLLYTALMASCEPMELSRIRYQFTTCNQTERRGPTYQVCMESYQNTATLSKSNSFFFFDQLDTNNEQFQGGQGFRIPKSGRYNLSLAGAAGGRGLCNTDCGRGLLWSGQANFTAGEELLILVGQKGRSPCDSDDFPGLSQELCSNPPQTEEDSATCNHTWYSNLLNFISPEDAFSFVYENIGGGGGGGASMIRLVNVTSQEVFPEVFPLVVAPGGGGSGALTNYSVINQTLVSLPSNSTFREEYQQFLDAKHKLYDPQDRPGFGTTGNIYVSSFARAGAGGGYFTVRDSANVDGGYLNAEENFAEGGFDCTRQLFELFMASPNIHGGFGGGGGQCGSGGGGGGFSGGRSTGTDHLLPGQGGYYYTAGTAASQDHQLTRGLVEISAQLNKLEDGYVELVLSDCGCSEGCTVNEEQDTFECHCPRNDTELAPNGFDCARDLVADFSLSNYTTLYIEEYSFTPVPLNDSISLLELNSLVFISSYNSTNTIEPLCSIVFFGANAEPVLSTNVVSSVHGTLDHLATISTHDGSLQLSEYHDSLPTPMTVTGGLLISEGYCHLFHDQINFTVSTHDVSQIPACIPDVYNEVDSEVLYSLAQLVHNELIMNDSTTIPTQTTPDMGLDLEVMWSLIGVSIFCFGVLMCVLQILLIKLVCNRCKQRKKKIHMESSNNRPILGLSTNSMVPNAFYHEFRSTANGLVPCFGNTYISARPPQRINKPENHGYEIIAEGHINDPITASAQHFPTKFGFTAPIHDFTSYNRTRVGDKGHSWEYPRDNLVYLRELGEGQFGKVLLMKAKGIANYSREIPVAVKTLSCRAPHKLELFIKESNLMKKFCHPNIISLLGVTSHDVNEDSAPLMILEYMPYGDLHDFLTKNRPQPGLHSMITPAHFFSIGRDVAEALNFLSSQYYVHRDIAARNCLVGPNLCIKIADFGLAREVLTKNYYKVEGNSVLPIKWMAPESLLFGIFTTASDVWSYGVLLWEAVTFGELPLEELTSEDVIKLAESKELIYPRPLNCPEEILTVMLRCHRDNPSERIEFAEILQCFSKDKIKDEYFKQ